MTHETELKLPVKANKLFSTDTHFHVKKALRHQHTIIALANQGDEEAIAVRNILINTIQGTPLSPIDSMILRYYLTGYHSKEIMLVLLPSNSYFTEEERNCYLVDRHELDHLMKKKKLTTEELSKKELLKKTCKDFESIVDKIANDLLDKMQETHQHIMYPEQEPKKFAS